MPVDFPNRQRRNRIDHRRRLSHHLQSIFNYDGEGVIVKVGFEINPAKLRGVARDFRAVL